MNYLEAGSRGRYSYLIRRGRVNEYVLHLRRFWSESPFAGIKQERRYAYPSIQLTVDTWESEYWPLMRAKMAAKRFLKHGRWPRYRKHYRKIKHQKKELTNG